MAMMITMHEAFLYGCLKGMLFPAPSAGAGRDPCDPAIARLLSAQVPDSCETILANGRFSGSGFR
jgi:hypothetical protein